MWKKLCAALCSAAMFLIAVAPPLIEARAATTRISSYNGLQGLWDIDHADYYLISEDLDLRNATIEAFQKSGSEWLRMPASNVFIMNNLSSSANLEINTQYANVSGNIYSFPNYRVQITFPDIVGKRGHGSKDVILTVDNITYTGLYGPLSGNLRLFEYSDFWNGFYTQSSSNAALNMDINISIEDAEDDESIGLIFYDIDVATPGYPEMVRINSGLIGQPVIPADHHDIGFNDASLSYYANDGSAEGEGSFRCGVSFLGKANGTSIHWQGAIGCGTYLGITSELLPKEYYVTYDSNNGTGDSYTDGEAYLFDTDYTPVPAPTPENFKKTGYYIKYWYSPSLLTRYTAGDPEWPAGTNNILPEFRNLMGTAYSTAILKAKWEPIKYILRVHENYANTSDRAKDYVIKYDSDFKLPYPSPWCNKGTVIGYDFNKTVKVSPTYSNQDYLRNLTTERNKVIDIYTIWDIPPVVTAPNEIHFSKLKCAASLLNQNNGTISSSDLEAELMTYVTATDYEWSTRYTGKIQPGIHEGYSFGISSFEPATIVEQATGENALVYYITFVCTDDYGQSGQYTTTLFIGDTQVDILVR